MDHHCKPLGNLRRKSVEVGEIGPTREALGSPFGR
jgi:hypothetical protein